MAGSSNQVSRLKGRGTSVKNHREITEALTEGPLANELGARAATTTGKTYAPTEVAEIIAAHEWPDTSLSADDGRQQGWYGECPPWAR
jgi:hypothetical protein